MATKPPTRNWSVSQEFALLMYNRLFLRSRHPTSPDISNMVNTFPNVKSSHIIWRGCFLVNIVHPKKMSTLFKMWFLLAKLIPISMAKDMFFWFSNISNGSRVKPVTPSCFQRDLTDDETPRGRGLPEKLGRSQEDPSSYISFIHDILFSWDMMRCIIHIHPS